MVNGRLKGNKAENDVCYRLTAWWGRLQLPVVRSWKVTELPFRRRFTTGIPVTGTWAGAGDILTKPESDFPYCVEVKKKEGWQLDGMLSNPKWPVWDWWQQCRVQAGHAGKHPLLLFSRNNAPWLVMTLRCNVAFPLEGEGPPVLTFGSTAVFNADHLPVLMPR